MENSSFASCVKIFVDKSESHHCLTKKVSSRFISFDIEFITIMLNVLGQCYKFITPNDTGTSVYDLLRNGDADLLAHRHAVWPAIIRDKTLEYSSIVDRAETYFVFRAKVKAAFEEEAISLQHLSTTGWLSIALIFSLIAFAVSIARFRKPGACTRFTSFVLVPIWHSLSFMFGESKDFATDNALVRRTLVILFILAQLPLCVYKELMKANVITVAGSDGLAVVSPAQIADLLLHSNYRYTDSLSGEELLNMYDIQLRLEDNNTDWIILLNVMMHSDNYLPLKVPKDRLDLVRSDISGRTVAWISSLDLELFWHEYCEDLVVLRDIPIFYRSFLMSRSSGLSEKFNRIINNMHDAQRTIKQRYMPVHLNPNCVSFDQRYKSRFSSKVPAFALKQLTLACSLVGCIIVLGILVLITEIHV